MIRILNFPLAIMKNKRPGGQMLPCSCSIWFFSLLTVQKPDALCGEDFGHMLIPWLHIEHRIKQNGQVLKHCLLGTYNVPGATPSYLQASSHSMLPVVQEGHLYRPILQTQ